MNFKRSTTSMAIALMVLSLISVTSIQQDAFAQSQGMMITATADKGSDTITVTGKTISDITDVTFRVTSPSGNNVVAVGQISPDDSGEFAAEFKVGPTWTEDGFYTISISDSGTQLQNEDFDKAFEPFYLNRGGRDTPDIGFYIAKMIAREHQGDIYFDKNAQECRVVFKLPKKSNLEKKAS